MRSTDPFSYSCTRCGQCCRDKRIRVNPYEVARLASARRITTTAFVAGFVDRTDMSLRQDAEGRCVFFDAGSGCSVHADRPLACRLFPLAMSLSETGEAAFERGRWSSEPRGDYSGLGSVDDFLDSQDAFPFIAAAKAYFAWYLRASGVDVQCSEQGERLDDILDIDHVVSRRFACGDEAIPKTVDSRVAWHLAWLHSLLEPKGTFHG